MLSSRNSAGLQPTAGRPQILQIRQAHPDLILISPLLLLIDHEGPHPDQARSSPGQATCGPMSFIRRAARTIAPGPIGSAARGARRMYGASRQSRLFRNDQPRQLQPDVYRWPLPELQVRQEDHISVGCFATRVSTFFGDGSVPGDAGLFDARHEPATVPSTAAGAVDCLEHMYRDRRESPCHARRATTAHRQARGEPGSTTTRWRS